MSRQQRTARPCNRLLVINAVAAALLCPAAAAAGPAPITSVVVYADRAQVTRTQTIDCAAGEASFTELPSTIQTKTLWASLTGQEGAVVGLTHREEASGPRAEAKALQQQVRQIDDQLVLLSGQSHAAGASSTKLESFKAHMRQIWGLQAAGKNPPVGSWDAALDLLRQQALAAVKKQRELATRRRSLLRDRSRLVEELQQIDRKRRRTTLSVTVMLKCAGRRSVELSYVVPGATWQMSYQLRADPAQRRVKLVAQAVVQQGTGEDWDGVALGVSTANLQRSNLPPELQRMRVSTEKPVDTRKVLTRRFERREHLKASLKEEARAEAPAGAAAPGQPAGAPDDGLAMRLTAARKVSVPADGRKVVVVLRQKEVRGSFFLETVPKLYPYVYNKVEIGNPFDFTMLPGPIELFSGRAYIGNATLKLRAPGEPFAFSLGVDNQLQVHRWVKKEKLKGAGTFGSSKELRHRYVLQVGNWRRAPVKVRVLENVPVSQVREIKVALGADATRPTKWDTTDGIVSYDLTVPSRNKKQIVLDYTVSLPKEYIVHGYQQED